MGKEGGNRSQSADRYLAGVLSQDRPSEIERLRIREEFYDDHTCELLARIGIRPTWRALDVGAGTGSVARWLARQCPQGSVTATEIDTRSLATEGLSNLRVLEHDAVTDDFPSGSVDLVHTRSVMFHIPERDRVLAKMMTWLAPGGWVLIEEPSILPFATAAHPRLNRLVGAFVRLIEKLHGADCTVWARSAPGLLAELGVTNIGLDIRPHYVGDGGLGEAVWRATLEQGRAEMIDLGLITAEEFESGLRLFDDPKFVDAVAVTVGVWGQKA